MVGHCCSVRTHTCCHKCSSGWTIVLFGDTCMLLQPQMWQQGASGWTMLLYENTWLSLHKCGNRDHLVRQRCSMGKAQCKHIFQMQLSGDYSNCLFIFAIPPLRLLQKVFRINFLDLSSLLLIFQTFEKLYPDKWRWWGKMDEKKKAVYFCCSKTYIKADLRRDFTTFLGSDMSYKPANNNHFCHTWFERIFPKIKF